MMHVLVVEDDENKSSQIVAFVRQMLGVTKISLARSYRGGLAKVLGESFDLVLLDMTMPTYDINLEEEGGRPRAFAGRDILQQMDRHAVTMPVVVVTQFDRFGDRTEVKTRTELDEELARAHPNIYRGMVYYDAGRDDWKDHLARRIRDVQESRLS